MKRISVKVFIFLLVFQVITTTYAYAADFSDGSEIFTSQSQEENIVVPTTTDSQNQLSDQLYRANEMILEYGSIEAVPSSIMNEELRALAANTWALFHTTDGELIYVYDYCTVPGASSYYVRLLQVCLSTIGFDVGVIDGIYGPNTEYAIVLFQRDQGLVADGIAGERTWRRLSNFFSGYGIYIDF